MKQNKARFGKISGLIKILLAVTIIAVTVSACTVNQTPLDAKQKDATTITAQQNQTIAKAINKDSMQHEGELAARGLIAAADGLNIISPDTGDPIWDLSKYSFLSGKAPYTVNPKLWEHAKHNMNAGLFQVSKNIYQVRGFDLANITFVRGTTGWIVIDPLTAQETAKEAYDFLSKALKETLPISAVIYTHSHVDHYGGVLGIAKKSTPIYAPDGFMDAVCEENLYAGVAMGRRSHYMYGSLLEIGEKGHVDGGLGKKVVNGTQSLLAPSVTVTETKQKFTVDGIEMQFQLTNGTEAPSEMNVYIPSEKALCIAENCTGTLHNLYTLRGAQVRDPEKWADYLDQTVKLFGKNATSVFSSHNWPRFGKEIVPYLQSQRDCYQYIKDQTLRLMSLGYTLDEVGRMVKLPKELSDSFFNGEFYGTVSHNAKAVYQKYLGWYDSNPVNLNRLLPEESAKKYVEYMGGADKALKSARADYEKGEYQWVAELTRQIIFADPDNKDAKLLCADALEQLGYIAESGPWRDEYLTAASELRNGVRLPDTGPMMKTDVYGALTDKQLATMLAIRLNGEKAGGKNAVFSITSGEITLRLHLRNGVLVYLDESTQASDFTVKMKKTDFYRLVSGARGELSYTVSPAGKEAEFSKILSMLDTADPRFAIVTP